MVLYLLEFRNQVISITKAVSSLNLWLENIHPKPLLLFFKLHFSPVRRFQCVCELPLWIDCYQFNVVFGHQIQCIKGYMAFPTMVMTVISLALIELIIWSFSCRQFGYPFCGLIYHIRLSLTSFNTPSTNHYRIWFHDLILFFLKSSSDRLVLWEHFLFSWLF